MLDIPKSREYNLYISNDVHTFAAKVVKSI